MIKAVIFDLDGTLLFTLDSIRKSVNTVLKNHSLPPQPEQNIKKFVGDGVIDLMIRAFKASGSAETVGDDIVAEFRACFKYDCDYNVKPYEGINEVIEYLNKNSIKVACNSNKPDVNAKLIVNKHFGDSICFVLGNVDYLPKKPDKAGAEVIIKELGISKDECVYIGDSDVDVFTAKNLGCVSIGAAWGYRGSEELKNSGADFIADQPIDIIEIIKTLNN